MNIYWQGFLFFLTCFLVGYFAHPLYGMLALMVVMQVFMCYEFDKIQTRRDERNAELDAEEEAELDVEEENDPLHR